MIGKEGGSKSKIGALLGSMLLPLALAQFICSYSATSMNVAISSISQDLGTTVQGVQVAITFFTLTMAALMIPGSKLTEILGRKKCFTIGLGIYGVGAFIAALTPGIGILIFGYSLLEGLGTALLIPPVYILATVFYSGIARAKAFGVISAAAGIGAAAGPLIGGLITSAISWRAAFITSTLVVLLILYLSRKIVDPKKEGPKPKFDIAGAILSALAMFFVISGILLTSTYGWFSAKEDFFIGSILVIPQGGISPLWLFLGIGVLFLAIYVINIRRREKAGKEPLLPMRLIRNKTSNLGLITQCVQWAMLQGSSFVISVFVQTIRGLSAITTGLVLTPATIGILLTSSLAGRFERKERWQKRLIAGGFIITIVGILLLLLMVRETNSLLNFVPGLFLFGAGIGIMLTSSVNVVQSAFPEEDQSEISGLSRSISNLGSSLGTSIVGSVLLISIAHTFGLALAILIILGIIGLVAAFLLPRGRIKPAESQPVS
jgi:MFS family permease